MLATKDELDNVNLITGLQSFFDPGIVSFDGGNIILGGGGNDSIKGGGGNDIIDGDAWLHVALSSQTAGAQIIRQILYDPNGNTWSPSAVNPDGSAGAYLGAGHNAANVDTAVYSDVFSDYDIALFGKDGEGFITVSHARAGAAIVGGNPQGLLGGNDGTDRIRNIERLQFTDITVSIDSDGNILTSSDGRFTDNSAVSRAHYDAVPVSTPSITESGGLDPTTTVTVGQTLTASVLGGAVAGINAVTDADGIASTITWQWQELDLLRGEWVNIVGATGSGPTSIFVPTTFQNGSLGIRAKASYIDGKGYKETVISAQTAAVTLPGNVNTAPKIAFATQFNGIADTTSVLGQSFDFFSPFASIFTDAQTAATALTYTATLEDGSSLASIGLVMSVDPTTAVAEFSAPAGFDTTGAIRVRVTATDTGPGTPLSVTNTFTINVVPPNTPPVAANDFYTALKDQTLTVAAPNGVLANDLDPNGDPFTAKLVAGPANGTLAFNPDGSFTYKGNALFTGTDKFTYQDTDIALGTGNIATVTITVGNFNDPPVQAIAPESASGLEDTVINGTLLKGTDPDGPSFNPDGTPLLTYKIVAGSASHGSVTLVDATGKPVASNTTGAYAFTPDSGYGTNTTNNGLSGPLFGGPATFQYVLNDGVADSISPKTVSVTVTPVNDGPATLTLSGAPFVGQVLTATLSADPDGAPLSGPVFTWLNNGIVMANVTGATYTTTGADIGHTFRVSASYRDGQNFAENVTTAVLTTNPITEGSIQPTNILSTQPVDTSVTAVNSLTPLFGAGPAAITYTWNTSADGVTYTTLATSAISKFSPGSTGTAGEYPAGDRKHHRRRDNAKRTFPSDPLYERHNHHWKPAKWCRHNRHHLWWRRQ